MNYKKIYWGLLLLFDIRINGFDILPDTIAYILIFIGLIDLAKENDYFQSAKLITFPLMILSVFEFRTDFVLFSELLN